MRSARTFGVCIIFLSTWAMAQNAIPTIEQPLVPTAAQPGGASFTLTINGAGFIKTPTFVQWEQGTNVTQFPIATATFSQLTATVPAANIAVAGTASVSVVNASGFLSNVQFFQIATPATPQFAAPVLYNPLITNTGAVQTILATDLNADGILDLAVGTLIKGVAQVAILFGNGDGTFQIPTVADIYAVSDSSSIVAGRFTNGGSIDLVAGNTLLTNNGSGVFTPTPLIVGGNVGFRPFAVGDFTHSAALDIAGLVGLNVQIINNNGASSFSLGQNFAAGIATAGGMLAADFDGDGFLDLAVLDISAASPGVRVFRGSAAGFSPGNGIPTATPQGGVAFTAADFNGDSNQDIAFVYDPAAGGGQVLILKGNGDGTFASGSPELLANAVSGAIVTGDFNEDGKLDLATGTYILQGNGDGTFQSPLDFGGTAQVLATGDFNGDGRPDLAAQSNPNVAVLLQQPPPVPVASLSPPNLSFSQTVGATSASQQITLTNTGNAVLNITAPPVIIGTNAAEFAQTTTCGATLAADNSCFINVTFTPTAAGTAIASVSVTDNAAGSPQTVPLTGLGLSPAAMLSPSPLTFSSQLAGASATLTVTLTNGGNAPLTITSIAFTGPNASEFGQTNNCPSSLAPDNSCTINVTFTPTAAGSATASLSVTDNAPGSPQTVPITGTSQSVLTTTCTSLTVVPGQTAIFTVDLAAVNEFAPTVSLSCSGEPAQATCTVSPSMVTPTGSTPVHAQVTVTTMRAFLQPPFGNSNENRMAGLVGLAGIAGFAALVVVPGRRRVKLGQRLCGLIFLLCILATLTILPSCGGTAGSDPPSTATGTYPLTVTGTFQSGGTTITEKVSFNLVVN